jgi:lipopolysaccharide export system permease protein
VIKKLDKLILGAFIGPFIATFFITLFVLVLQFFWLYIDDIVGKGIDLPTLGRFILYVSSTLVPLALPLAVLLSSIMTFGNLGESFELVAIKSAGIPLLRFMRPLFVASLFLSGLAFLFNNYFIPVAKLRMETMKYDIIKSKPALDIKEGVFYDKIEGFVIKIGKKDPDGSTIRNVIIYEKNYGLQDNIIIADSGKMTVGSDKRFLNFVLFNGTLFQESGPRMSTATEYVRMGFQTYTKQFDLSSFKLNKTADSTYSDRPQMRNIAQLEVMIDSLQKMDQDFRRRAKREIFQYIQFARLLDSNWTTTALPDSVLSTLPNSLDSLLQPGLRESIEERALAQAQSLKTSMEASFFDFEGRQKEYRFHLIEWHSKLTMSIACLVMFLIGAPLGSIIRKGGLGTPLVFAVIFFVIFFLLNNFGNKFVREGVTKAWSGMWLATMVLTPIGLFLTYKAMHDSQLFNKEFYHRFLQKWRNRKK